MGDTGEAFKVFNKMKSEERSIKEPHRRDYAIKKLDAIDGIRCLMGMDLIEIYIDRVQIDFWPFTGWFCGRKPIGQVKGRGINNLVKEIEKLKGD